MKLLIVRFNKSRIKLCNVTKPFTMQFKSTLNWGKVPRLGFRLRNTPILWWKHEFGVGGQVNNCLWRPILQNFDSIPCDRHNLVVPTFHSSYKFVGFACLFTYLQCGRCARLYGIWLSKCWNWLINLSGFGLCWSFFVSSIQITPRVNSFEEHCPGCV